MSSIQERLQLKRVPLDTWNIREQLCLASAVVRSGDQNWMSVSRALKTVGEPNRPPDWYSQKSCAAQYGALLEHVETPKRKKRCPESAGETPQESIVKRLTQERIVEIQKTIAEMNQQYDLLKNEITEVRNPATSDERLREIWNNIEAAKRAREKEIARRAAWLKEREERRARADRTWRPAPSQPTTPTSPAAPVPVPPSSPLLTSLLKSSPVVTTPQHIPHPASVVDTLSPSVQAPTLSMLLEKSPQHDNKYAAIEHIKSQLVQIEQQLKASSAPSTPIPTPCPPPAPAPAVDIDDIEIKAEDVYVFRDIDIHIPQVGLNNKNNRQVEKTPTKKEEEDIIVDNETTHETVKEEQVTIEDVPQEEHVEVEIEQPEPTPMEVDEPVPNTEPTSEQPEVKLAFPEVKFPTTEIKVIQPDETKIKDEKEEAIEDTQNVKEEVEVNEEDAVSQTVTEENSSTYQPTPPPPPTSPPKTPPQVTETPPNPPETPNNQTERNTDEQIDGDIEQQMEAIHASDVKEIAEVGQVSEVGPVGEMEQGGEVGRVSEAGHVGELGEGDEVGGGGEMGGVGEMGDPQDIPLPPEPEPEHVGVSEPPLPPEVPPTEPEPEPEVKQETEPEINVDVSTVNEKSEDDIKKDEDAEDSIPLKQMLREDSQRQEIREEKSEEVHTETDDDTPMELSREEEKDGKKKRDYSRKKKPDSRTCSGSESAPESPASSDADRQHRLWKKSVMLVYSRLCAHKYASLFLRPITDEEAPGYSLVVKRPMDLTTIRRNIENGLIRTTAQFQRDVLLMLSNALMYNSSEHSVYTMAKEMHQEASSQLGMLLAAQAHAGLCAAPPSTRKHRHRN